MPTYKLIPAKDEDLRKMSSGQVRNPFDFDLKQEGYPPVRGGIFDAKIFGSLGKCPCGNKTRVGEVCPVCKAHVVDADGASRRIGHYMLSYPIVSRYKLDLLIEKLIKFHPVFKALKSSKEDRLLKLYNTRFALVPVAHPEEEITEETIKKNLYVVNEDGTFRVVLSELKEGDDVGEFTEYGVAGLKTLSRKYKPHALFPKSFSFITDYFNQCLMILPITERPAYFRPDVQAPDFNIFNTYYRGIITMDSLLPKIIKSRKVSVGSKISALYMLNRRVDDVFDQYSMVATSKLNFIRNKLTLRVTESGRSNIIGAPDLKVDEVYLPRSLVYEAVKGRVIDEFSHHPDIIKRPREEYLYPSKAALEIFENMVQGWGCLMLRNPTIQKYNISPFRVKLWDNIAIGLPLLSVKLFNADFDGDQMAFYLIPDRNKTEMYMKMMGPDTHWEFEKNNDPLFAPEGSILDGMYLATKLYRPDGKLKRFKTKEELYQAYEQPPFEVQVDEVVVLGKEETTYGREKVADICGFRLEDVLGDKEKAINAKTIKKVMVALGQFPDKTERLRNLQQLAQETVTYDGSTTVSLSDIYHATPDAPEFMEILNSNDPNSIKFRRLTHVLNTAVKHQVMSMDNQNLQNILAGSGKLKMSSISALVGPRFELDRHTNMKFYENTLSQGYDEEAYVSHAIENRQILIEKQKLVPGGGYFSRQLVDLLYDIRFTEKPSLSPVGAVLTASDSRGRVVIGSEGENELGEPLVRVKSMIDGATETVSREELSSEKPAFMSYTEGTPIGISMGQSFAEPSIQASLGLKHGGSLVKPSMEVVCSITAGKVVEREKDYMVVENDGVKYKYILPYRCLLSNAIDGEPFEEGKILFYEDKMVHVEYKLASLFKLIDSYVISSDSVVSPREIATAVCYAPNDGAISYDISHKKLKIGETELPLNRELLYKFPEGYVLKKGQRFSTGLIDLVKFQEIVGDLGWTFYVFKDQLDTILGGSGLNVELYEAIFKVIHNDDFSIRMAHKNMGKLFNEINLSHAKRAIESALRRDTIGAGFLTDLFLE